jgi:hypothetical protein
MVAKLGLLEDFQHRDSIKEIRSNFCVLDFLHDATLTYHCCCSLRRTRLSHSEETPELRRTTTTDPAPGEETQELRGATQIDSAVTQEPIGIILRTGTLGHSIVTKGDFGHTLTRVLQGLQPKNCMKGLGHTCCDSVRQWAPTLGLETGVVTLTTPAKTVPGLTILGQHNGLHPQDWKGDSVEHMTGLINGMQITQQLHNNNDIHLFSV